MENLKKIIDEARKKKGYSIKRLCDLIGMTEGGYHAMIKNNTAKLKTIERISEELDISVKDLLSATGTLQENSFFSNNTNINISDDYWRNKYEESQKTIRTLLNTIEQMSLGKFDTVLQSQTVAA